MYPEYDNGRGRGMPREHIHYYGRSGTGSGTTTITFINHNPVYTRVYWIDENGNEQYGNRVEAYSTRTEKTMGNHVWVIKRDDGYPIRVCKAVKPGKEDKGTACIASNQRMPAWPTANFTFDIVGKTLTYPAVELRVPVTVLITNCQRSDRITAKGQLQSYAFQKSTKAAWGVYRFNDKNMKPNVKSIFGATRSSCNV
jgi:adenosine/AMP kinase